MALWQAIVGTFTALFAGIGAMFIFMQWRDQIVVDTLFHFLHPRGDSGGPDLDKPQNVMVEIKLRNRSSRSVRLASITVDGIPFAGATYEKITKRLDATETSADDQHQASLWFTPDWAAMQSQFEATGREPRIRASVSIDRNALVYWPSIRVARRFVPADIITQNAAKASQIS